MKKGDSRKPWTQIKIQKLVGTSVTYIIAYGNGKI